MLIFVQILPFIIFCYFLTVLFSIHLYLVVFNIFIWNWVLTVNFSWSGNYSHKSKIIFQFLSHFCLELAQCQALTQCQALALHQLKSGDLKRSLWSSSSTSAEIWRSFDKDYPYDHLVLWQISGDHHTAHHPTIISSKLFLVQ